MSDTLTGRKIGKYQILEKLGRGGMAEVYKAYQENLDRYVAIKLMHAFLASEQDFQQRFKREARAMAAMNHPNIVGVYDFDAYQEDTYYLVMEYIAGGTLKQRLEELTKKQERLELGKAVRIGYQVAEALDYAHTRGMVHRDVKPANIMLGDKDRALLTDFGIVKMMGGQTMAYTATGSMIGTPSYMSPEQAMGKPGDQRVDIYALGILLFQMTTGQLPYTADTPLAVIMKHVNEPAPQPVALELNVPPDLQDVILKAMAKDPDERYQTAGDMAEDLRAVRLDASAQSGVFVAASAAAKPLSGTVELPPVETPTHEAQANTAVSATAIGVGVDDSTPTFQSIPPPSQTQPTPPSAPIAKKRSPWLFVGLGLLILALWGGMAVTFSLLGDRNPDIAATIAAAVHLTEESRPSTTTETAVATTTEEPTRQPTDVSTTPHGGAQLPPTTASPTATSSPTPTPSPTPLIIVTRQKDGAAMVQIPASVFMMGAADDDEMAGDAERPLHEVTLDNFLIDQFEVTTANYAVFLNEKGSYLGVCNGHTCLHTRFETINSYLTKNTVSDEYIARPGFANYPINNISWHGAYAYCDWVGARLPTEAEWELAARGIDNRLYPWGNETPDETRALFNTTFNDLQPVDALADGMSPFGVYGLAGSVWEWVVDEYKETFYAESPTDNPANIYEILRGTDRVLRGGSYASTASELRSTHRASGKPLDRNPHVGFRCAASVIRN